MFQADIALHVVVGQKSYELVHSVSEFNEFEPRLKSAKNQFQLRTGLNLEKFDKVEPTIFKPRLKFFKFVL